VPLHKRGIQQNSCAAHVKQALAQLFPAPAYRFTMLLRRKSSPSGDLGLQRRSRRARGPLYEHRVGNVLAARGLVVKLVEAVELRIFFAAVLAAAADAVLVAHRLPKLGAHLVTALARLYVGSLARRSSLEAGSTRDKKRRGEVGGEGGGAQRTPCESWGRETGNTGDARACIPNGRTK
jgi:hypothetical protein